MGTLSVLGIILLFFFPEVIPLRLRRPSQTREELFTQVISAARPQILKLWEEGDRFIGKEGLQCPEELEFSESVGRGYYQCQPHFWQCYWSGGVRKDPVLEVELYGTTYHVIAKRSFPAIPAYANSERFYQMFKRQESGINLHYGYVIELFVKEIPDLVQPMILADTCRDTYLPERVYAYGNRKEQKAPGFIWDNFGRKIFIDKFYVTNQQVNEWRILTNDVSSIVKDRRIWPRPALLSLKEQKDFCHFFGKKVLDAQLFDAATMPPENMKNPIPDRVGRPETPWHRDVSKTFLGMARINADYQLTPLDCQLAQVHGCSEKWFTTDSATWMGINYAIGFSAEAFHNVIEPQKNLKLSSRLLPAHSEWHELGKRSFWNGIQGGSTGPVAFRCYEEVSL